MNLYLLTIIIVVLFLVEIGYFRIARFFNIIDKPNLRSSHTKPTIRGGGVIFILGLILWAIVYRGVFIYPWFLAGAVLISLISFIDDIHSVPNRYRILIHFASVLLLLFECGFLNIHGCNILLTIAVLIVATGIINAFNFMDGINGITGFYGLAVLFPILWLNSKINFVESQLIIISIVSLLVFCFFNFRKKAKCFAGDVGSVSIAFIIVFFLGRLIYKTQDISYIMFLAVYGVDTIMTIIHRLYLKENIFEAHREHCFQLLANELRMPHLVVSSIYFVIQLSINVGLIVIDRHRMLYCSLILMFLIVVYWTIIKRYFHLHHKAC